RFIDKKNQALAFSWYLKAARQGVVVAQNNLATMYYLGQGTKKDKNKAFYWYKKSAEANDAAGQLNLGLMYLTGDEVVKKNVDLALSWLEKSALNGNKVAQLKFADIYREGNLVNIDYLKALKYYAMAAKQKSTKAMFYIGFFYFEGLGVRKDTAKAKIWMKRAETLGHERAKNFLIMNKM
ncbi:MAG: tetratricopeptide repeat protein, partial [Aliarcobacter sp.]